MDFDFLNEEGLSVKMRMPFKCPLFLKKKFFQIIGVFCSLICLIACIDHNPEPNIQNIQENLKIPIPENFEIIHAYKEEDLDGVTLEFMLEFTKQDFKDLMNSIEQSEGFLSHEAYSKIQSSQECSQAFANCPNGAWYGSIEKLIFNYSSFGDPMRDFYNADYQVEYKYDYSSANDDMFIFSGLDSENQVLHYLYMTL